MRWVPVHPQIGCGGKGCFCSAVAPAGTRGQWAGLMLCQPRSGCGGQTCLLLLECSLWPIAQSRTQSSRSLRLAALFTPLICFKSYVGELPRALDPKLGGGRWGTERPPPPNLQGQHGGPVGLSRPVLVPWGSGRGVSPAASKWQPGPSRLAWLVEDGSPTMTPRGQQTTRWRAGCRPTAPVPHGPVSSYVCDTGP